MLSLTILTMAVAVTSALPRGELGMEEGNLYPGLYRDQTMDEKEGRNLDSIDSLQNKNQNTATMKRNLSEMQKSQWSKRDGVSIQRPIYNHRHDKKEGGTLDSLGGGHLIRNLHGNGDNYEHEIKKEALNTDYHLDTSKAILAVKLPFTTNIDSKGYNSYSRLNPNGGEQLVKNVGRRFRRDYVDSLGGGHLIRGLESSGDYHLGREFLDPLGGGHLIRGLESSGGGSHLGREFLDPLGGGNLIRGFDSKSGDHLGREFLDPLGGGHLIRGLDSKGNDQSVFLDPLGGGHLIRGINSKGGDHLGREFLDPLGGGHLIRQLHSKSDGSHLGREFLDPLGGGHLIRGINSKGGDHLGREFLDPLGGGHLIRGINSKSHGSHLGREFLDPLGGGHLIRGSDSKDNDQSVFLDPLGGDHLIGELTSKSGGHLAREFLDPLGGGGNLLRDLEAVLRTHPNLFYGRSARNHDALDSLSGITFGSQKRYDSLSPAYAADKRNFDEIDRTGFNSFIKKKKNFDEIDRTGFDGFVKRNFDEIDRVGFGSFIKKSGDPRH